MPVLIITVLQLQGKRLDSILFELCSFSAKVKTVSKMVICLNFHKKCKFTYLLTVDSDFVLVPITYIYCISSYVGECKKEGNDGISAPLRSECVLHFSVELPFSFYSSLRL